MTDYSNFTDEQLVSECKAGNEFAWSQLMKRYRPFIERFAVSHFRVPASEIDDFVSDAVFNGLCSAVRHYKPGGPPFSTFASRCIKNACLNTLNRRNSQKRIPLEATVSIDEQAGAISGDYDVQQQLEIRAELREVEAAIARLLTERENEALRLWLDGESHAEIAERLGITRKAAETSVYRAKKKLKAYFYRE